MKIGDTVYWTLTTSEWNYITKSSYDKTREYRGRVISFDDDMAAVFCQYLGKNVVEFIPRADLRSAY